MSTLGSSPFDFDSLAHTPMKNISEFLLDNRIVPNVYDVTQPSVLQAIGGKGIKTISYNNWNALVSQLCFEAYNRMVSIYNHATKNIDDREFYLKWCEPFRGHDGNKISWAKKILGDTEASCDLFELSRTLYKMSREKGFADTPASLLRELFLQFTCTYCQYGFERSAFSRQRRSV